MERGGQVDGDDVVPGLVGKLDQVRGDLDSGIVDKDVDAAERGVGVGDHPPGAGAGAQVGAGDGDLHAGCAFEAGAGGLDRLRVAQSMQHDVGALGGQRGGDAEADAAGRAGDERDPPGE